MGAYHHKGELVNFEAPLARYRFLPDAYADFPATGVFEVSIDTWQFEITQPSGTDGSLSDKACTIALVRKLKKHMQDDDEPPKVIWYIG